MESALSGSAWRRPLQTNTNCFLDSLKHKASQDSCSLWCAGHLLTHVFYSVIALKECLQTVPAAQVNDNVLLLPFLTLAPRNVHKHYLQTQCQRLEMCYKDMSPSLGKSGNCYSDLGGEMLGFFLMFERKRKNGKHHHHFPWPCKNDCTLESTTHLFIRVCRC